MTTAAATVDASMSGPAGPARSLYAVSGWRKTVICFVFLILLPFFASLPAMIGMRLMGGLYKDAFGLLVLGAAFTVVMHLLYANLMFSLRARVELGEKTVRLSLPLGRGPLSVLRYRNEDVPYTDIAAVEIRKEIYGGSFAPVMLEGARLIKKDGTSIQLGYDTETHADAAFPYAEIARAIAVKAGLAVTDKGHVRRSIRSKMMGVAAIADAPVPEEEIARLNASHRQFVIGLIVFMLVLVGAGLAQDLIYPPSSDEANMEKPVKAKPVKK